ncbi:MAG: hypothetical protein EOO00_10410 [Chitinophagaceae bacterium]|nr:MAG: hypothetical protein EOO00_10410 [Chitinophagaceae bacterium]
MTLSQPVLSTACHHIKHSFIQRIILIVVISSFLSCKKDNASALVNAEVHHLENFGESTIKMKQGVAFFDKTALNDSLSFVNPPTDKYYEWKAIPDNGCVLFSDDSRHGFAQAVINCAGTYQLFAQVFDSASNSLIAVTDTVTFDVKDDILLPGQPIFSSDVLTIAPSITKGWLVYDPSEPFPTGQADIVDIDLHYTTTASYEYYSGSNEIAISRSETGNNRTFSFGDSVELVQYPYARGIGTFDRIEGIISIKDLQFGVLTNISIVWLGQTYSGTLTLINEDQYSLEWNNNSAVKFTDGCCRVN